MPGFAAVNCCGLFRPRQMSGASKPKKSGEFSRRLFFFSSEIRNDESRLFGILRFWKNRLHFPIGNRRRGGLSSGYNAKRFPDLTRFAYQILCRNQILSIRNANDTRGDIFQISPRKFADSEKS